MECEHCHASLRRRPGTLMRPIAELAPRRRSHTPHRGELSLPAWFCRLSLKHPLTQLRRWADVVLIAPCSANTLAKLCAGICDNLLTSLMRALDASRTKVYVFPAMNTFMYDHPLTAPQLAILRNVLKYNVVGPVGKVLACGDVGE